MSGDEVRREDVERELVDLVRDELLGGTDRPIQLDAPLGQTGVGLDSLGVLQLVTAIEAEFGIPVPDEFLTSHGSVTLAEIVDFVTASAPVREPKTVTPTQDPTAPPVHHRMERLRHGLEGYGLAGRLLWATALVAWPAARFAFSRSRHVILERSLQAVGQAPVESPVGVTLHDGIPTGADLSILWPDFLQARSRRSVEKWLRKDAWALTAVEGERVVALDLLSSTGSDEVELRADRLACWGHSLYEAPVARGRGIGLALLAYSLSSANERGFRSQLALVRNDNRPMLAACSQLLGFQAVGTATRTRVLGLMHWSWEVEGRRGRGRRLTL